MMNTWFGNDCDVELPGPLSNLITGRLLALRIQSDKGIQPQNQLTEQGRTLDICNLQTLCSDKICHRAEMTAM